MQDSMTNGKSKAQFVADVLNRTLATLITRCTKSEGTRDYFEVGVLGYSGSTAENGLAGALSGTILHPISQIEANPLRVEDRIKRVDDGAGGLVEQAIKFPVWFEPKASGGTPMCNAITSAAEQLVAWCDAHPDSYPPTVLHITDGESTDGEPGSLAQQLQQISTNDGNVLLFNLHVDSFSVCPALYLYTFKKLQKRKGSKQRWNLVALFSMAKLLRLWTSLILAPVPPSYVNYGISHPV